jgi:hypothetical protein
MDRAENALFFILDKGSDIMERDFKGIWITREIWLSEDLGWSEKLLFVEIDSLAKNGECFASNEHFARFFGLSTRHIQRLLATLKAKGYISINLIYKAGSKEVEKRIITPMTKTSYPHDENDTTPHDILDTTPHDKNVVDNNTSFNNTKINNTTNKNYIGEFETLWSIYPNKKGREQALKAYIKARKAKVEYETIKIGLQKYIKYVQIKQTEKQYIKHGSTFFNQHAWADEYDLNADRPKGIFGLIYDEYQEHHGGDIFEQERGNESFSGFTELLPEPFEVIGRGQHSKYDSADMGKQF